MEPLDYFFIPLIIIIGFIISHQTAKKTGSSIIYLLFIYHLAFSFIYYKYAESHTADANMYFYKSRISNGIMENWGVGTDFIIFLSSFFVKGFGFSKLSLFFLFGLFGFIGFIYLIKIFYILNPKFLHNKLSLIILFLPGFHFWTAALGKDSLFFMLLMLLFYNLIKLSSSSLIKLLLSWIALTFLRPHMGFIVGFAILIGIFFRNPAKYKSKHLFIAALSIIFIILFFPYLIQFLNVDEMQMEEINQRLQTYNEYGAKQADELSSYVDVTGYPLPVKMFTYLFRPLFFDAHSLLQLIASIENLILLILILKWMKSLRFRLLYWYKKFPLSFQIISLYIILSWIILAAGMYNLGLASRQKFMIIPTIFILFALPYYTTTRNSK